MLTGVGISALGRALKPLCRLCGTATDAVAFEIAHPERILRARDPVFRGGDQIAKRFVILRLFDNAFPMQIAEREFVLRFGMPLLCRAAKPFARFFVVGFSALVPNAAGIEQTELIFGVAVVLTRRLPIPMRGFVEVSCDPVSALIEIAQQYLRHGIVHFRGTAHP